MDEFTLRCIPKLFAYDLPNKQFSIMIRAILKIRNQIYLLISFFLLFCIIDFKMKRNSICNTNM